MIRSLLLAAGFAGALAVPLAAARQAPSPAIQAAVSSASRPAADVKKDGSRHPAEILSFARVKPGDVVVDLIPGTGYWTRLFSAAVGPSGHVEQLVPKQLLAAHKTAYDDAKALAAEPGRGNVGAELSDLTSDAPDAQVDLIFTFQNYHDLHDKFMQPLDVAAFDRAAFKALKPGGLFVIADHAAAAGSGLAATDTLHRIDPATVRSEVEAAGFVFDGQTTVLANPDDAHTALVFDPSIRGRTDQFVYRFRKPA